MSRTYRILLVAVVAVGAVGGYWKMVLAPKRAEAAALAQQVLAQKTQLAQTQSVIADYEGARDAYQSNYASVVRLGKAVPGDDDTRSLVVQLDAAAKRSGVDFDNIDINGGASAGSTSAGAAAVTTPGAVSTGAFSAMPFTFSFTGDFSTLSNFFSRLERMVSVQGDRIAVDGRLLRVESLTLEPAEDGWPGLHAQVGASSYIVPAAQGLKDSASAQVPAASTSTTTTATAATGPTSGGALR